MTHLRRFDKYMHELGIEHTHDFIADGELIIRKRLPDKEPLPLENGYLKFKEASNSGKLTSKEK